MLLKWTGDEPEDARAVANLILSVAELIGVHVRHLALQKILYYAHGSYLISRRMPLVAGGFEAWPHGPVHPVVYQTFKSWGAQPILSKGTATDIVSGAAVPISDVDTSDRRAHIAEVSSRLFRFTDSELRRLSHAKDSPWYAAWNEPRTSTSCAVSISDRIIFERFKFHVVEGGADDERIEDYNAVVHAFKRRPG